MASGVFTDPIVPEHLLVRRYQLQADLWGLRLEIPAVERQVASLQQKLARIPSGKPNATKAQRREWRARIQALHEQLDPRKERLHFLYEQQHQKRKELATIEMDLRTIFKATASSTLANYPKPRRPATAVTMKAVASSPFLYDLFICHAFEDKDEVVRPLVTSLRALGLRIWYDEAALTVGDGLRASIDRGLARSRFGVVIISPAFMKKRWTSYELGGLVAREMESDKVVLPVWHKVTKDEVLSYSPALVDKLALHTATTTTDDIALEIAVAVYYSITD